MTAFEIYGWACAILSAGVSLPQLVKLFKAKTSAGLSLLLWQLTFAVAAAWVFHGTRLGSWNLVVANGIMFVGCCLLLWLIGRDRKLNVLQVMSLPVALTAVLFVLDLKAALAFSLAISAAQLIGAFAQMIDLLKAADIRGVSPGFLAYSVFVNVIWLIWGLWGGDRAIQFAAGSLGTVALINLVLWLLRRSGALKPRGGTPEDAESDGVLAQEGVL